MTSVNLAPRMMTASLMSTLSPTLVNEFRMGSRKNWYIADRPSGDTGCRGRTFSNILPKAKAGLRHSGRHKRCFQDHLITSVSGAATRSNQFAVDCSADNLSWTKGKHAFKEAARTSAYGFTLSMQAGNLYPVVTLAPAAGCCQYRRFRSTASSEETKRLPAPITDGSRRQRARIQQAFFRNRFE